MGTGPNAFEVTELEVDGVTLVVSTFAGPPGDDRLILLKDREMVERYERLLAEHRRPRMVELGIMHGGSTAFFALRAAPEKLVAVERSEERRRLLDELIADRGLEGVVSAHYGVDQADAERLRAIVREEFADAPLDLVIDDASHLYAPTKASFDVLFPLLRPGGQYVIEDWSYDHIVRTTYLTALTDPRSPLHAWALERRAALEGDTVPVGDDGFDRVARSLGYDRESEPPLSKLGHQLLVASTEGLGGVASVTFDRTWIVVTRNEEELDVATYAIDDHARDHFGLLSPI